MSGSGFLEKLLDGADVEWKYLGDNDFFEVANQDRKPVKAKLRVLGETPYFGANNIQDYVKGHTHEGDYVLIAEDGSTSLEYYSIQYATGRFWANNHIHVVQGKDNLNSRYLFHYLHLVNFIPFLTGGSRPKLTKGQMVKIKIPIPCPEDREKSLAIQGEIVRILDTFSELTAELTARKKQYQYYREKLLTFDDADVEWKPISEVFHLKNGYTPSKSQQEFWVDGTVPWFRMDDIRNHGRVLNDSQQKVTKTAVKGGKLFPANSIIVATTATIGEHALITVPFLANQRFTTLSLNELYIDKLDTPVPLRSATPPPVCP